MYRHLKVTSLKQMNREIIKFLSDLLGVPTELEPEPEPEPEPISYEPKPALKSIKDFIYSLNYTRKVGMDAVDEAVAYASGGAFANTQALIDSLLSDLENNSGGLDSEKKAFLKNYCDIDLDNADVGAITGADAGGGAVKTSDDVVPESSSGPISSWPMPTGRSATFHGLTIIWPDTLYDIPDQASVGTGFIATVEMQQQIMRALNTEWMENCLNLVADSIGMDFEDSGAMVRTMRLKFENYSDRSYMAFVRTSFSGSRTTRLELVVNMYYFGHLIDDNVNGYDYVSRSWPLDRTIAHELTHAVMSTNISNYAKLPTYVLEGMASVVEGADDARRGSIMKISDPTYTNDFRRMLEGQVDNIDGVVSQSVYSGGYIFLRYLAKHSLEPVTPDIPDTPDPMVIRRVLSKNGKNVMWFVTDSERGGLAVWISDNVVLRKRSLMKSRNRDIVDLDYPWDDDSTVGVAGRYELDMWRKEIDEGETSTAKSKLRDENRKGYDVLVDGAETAEDMRDAKLIWYQNEIKIDDEIEQYKDVCHRVETTNACHLGGILKYSEVPDTDGYKWLDCLYNGNTFMFSLYQPGIPNKTRNLIIGEIDVYHADTSGKTYFMSNSWILKSYVKDGSYNDSFFLADIVGENRIPQQQNAISMGENSILDGPVDNYNDKKAEEERIKSELDAKEAEWKSKNELAESKRDDYDKARNRAYRARADAEQETDPDEKARKETWADELESSADRLDDEASELEDDAASAEQEYWDLYAEYDEAKRATKSAYDDVKDVYINTFTSTLQAVPSKEGNYNNHIADCPSTDEVITYNNDIFCAYRLDVDADNIGDANYSVNGHKTAFHLHTAPEDLHLRYYDVSDKYYPPESLTSPKVVGWEHQILHYTYGSYESSVGANIYPLLDTEKKEYDVWDELAEKYKSFQCFSRSGTGGNSVNNVNNMSTVIPLIFYVERDDETGDTWSAVGQTDIVNYINMYNMSTGTMFCPKYNDSVDLFGCYNLWMRRMEITPWNPVINDEDNSWTEVWGFGGYPGIAFRVDLKDNLTELRSRVVE